DAYEADLPIDVQRVCEKLEEAGNLQSIGKANAVLGIWTDGNADLAEHYTEELDKTAQQKEAAVYATRLFLEGITPGSAENFANIVERVKPRRSLLSGRTAADIIAMPYDSQCFLGDQLLFEGSTLSLVGPADIGKSRAVLQ